MYRRMFNRTIDSTPIYCHIAVTACKHDCGKFHSRRPTAIRRIDSIDDDRTEKLPTNPSSSGQLTLEDILETARKKISTGVRPDSNDEATLERRAASPQRFRVTDRRQTSWNSVKGIRSIEERSSAEGTEAEEDEELSGDPTEPAEWLHRQPPAFSSDEEDDVSQLLRVTKPPCDRYSNPTWHDSDSLKSPVS